MIKMRAYRKRYALFVLFCDGNTGEKVDHVVHIEGGVWFAGGHDILLRGIKTILRNFTRFHTFGEVAVNAFGRKYAVCVGMLTFATNLGGVKITRSFGMFVGIKACRQIFGI